MVCLEAGMQFNDKRMPRHAESWHLDDNISDAYDRSLLINTNKSENKMSLIIIMIKGQMPGHTESWHLDNNIAIIGQCLFKMIMMKMIKGRMPWHAESCILDENVVTNDNRSLLIHPA